VGGNLWEELVAQHVTFLVDKKTFAYKFPSPTRKNDQSAQIIYSILTLPFLDDFGV
jgi:hypothetical protein